jgi:hypothetical protein
MHRLSLIVKLLGGLRIKVVSFAAIFLYAPVHFVHARGSELGKVMQVVVLVLRTLALFSFSMSHSWFCSGVV